MSYLARQIFIRVFIYVIFVVLFYRIAPKAYAEVIMLPYAIVIAYEYLYRFILDIKDKFKHQHNLNFHHSRYFPKLLASNSMYVVYLIAGFVLVGIALVLEIANS